MKSRRAAALGAASCIGLVVAQYLAPTWSFFHVWQYAVALALLATLPIGYARSAKNKEGEVGARLAIAALGAVVIVAAGIASGLLGPDTQTISRAPGTVAPLPDVAAVAFFPVAGAAAIARGDAGVLLRRRNGSELQLVPGRRTFVGATALELAPQTAAYVEARDLSGRRLTVTQPTNATFLSPVLLFPEKVVVAGKEVAADSFAAPAVHRRIKAFFFPKGAVGAGTRGPDGDAVLFAVDGEDGKLEPGGIGFAPAGRDGTLGGLRLHATLGTYPAVVISAVPYPLAIWVGMALFLGGIAYAAAAPREETTPKPD